MFVYATCAGASGKLASVLRPSLERHGFGPLLVRQGSPSIYDAYNEMLDEALTRWPELEGVVLLHDDVAIGDAAFETILREAFADPGVGVAGVIGGRGHAEMSWWKTDERFGRVGSPVREERYEPGPAPVDTVDGLLMAIPARVAREFRLDGEGYPGFHGYDSELCALVKAAGMTVLVIDTDVYHDHKPPQTASAEWGWALYEWMLRWRRPTLAQSVVWRFKRVVLRQLSVRGIDPGRLLRLGRGASS